MKKYIKPQIEYFMLNSDVVTDSPNNVFYSDSKDNVIGDLNFI